MDDFGEGYPVAWCISNHENEKTLTHFLNLVKKNLGDFDCTPKWFISDMAYQYFNAWEKVFGKWPRKLLCIWHIDRAWHSNLSSISNVEERAVVYKQLRVILEETNEDMAKELIVKCLEVLKSDDETTSFAEYFEHEYSKRAEQWCISSRINSQINTNMYVKSFHRVLKHMYMHGKTNKRLDRLLFLLLKLARDWD